MNLKPLFFGLIFLSGCQSGSPPPNTSERLSNILDQHQLFLKSEYPSMDSVYDRLPSMTQADIDRRVDHANANLEKLQALDLDDLSFEETISWELFKFIQEDQVQRHQFKDYLNPLLVDAGFHIGFAFLPASYEFNSAADYENYLKVLKSFPQYVDQHIDLLKQGLQLGICQPQVILEGYEVTFDKHIVINAEESLFYQPFLSFPNIISESDQDRLQDLARQVVMDHVVAGYQSFSSFMKSDYMINTRTATAAYDLPEGEAYYQQRINYYTTLQLTPDSIHQLGLQEVARIKAEMMKIIDEIEYLGSFEDFLAYLRTDAKFYAQTPKELLMTASYMAKKMDGKLPALFGKLPRQPYTVNPVPDHLAPKYTGGRYVEAREGSTKPGQYWVNTYALENRPLYVLEALTFHEAVPGHHLQTALTSELDHLPQFRQDLYLSAFGEGWGLYSEFLGLEAGFYQDPYSNFGRLTYEMWRACRLVVDTGIHAKRWTRQEAMDYMADNTALSLHEIGTEVDRYISWPAQALSYKIGELKIKALRKKAEAALGKEFDVREFHDLVLSQGTVTLPILKQMVDHYIEEK
ncbi:MAG: DUF885 domain-containing protein [Cyclobacteriaceae bacterium]